MSQNLIQLQLTDDAWSHVDAAITALEAELTQLVDLSIEQRRTLTKMGDKSEAFCRQAVDAFEQHPEILPRNFDLDALRGDLKAFDALRPRLMRLTRLHERSNDTVMALGGDLMHNALEGYAVLKVAGKGEGLDEMRKQLSARFKYRRTRPDVTVPTPPGQSIPLR